MVKWESLADIDNSWEDLFPLQQHYPCLDLGDKVTLDGWGNVTFPCKVARKIVDQSTNTPLWKMRGATNEGQVATDVIENNNHEEAFEGRQVCTRRRKVNGAYVDFIMG